MVRIESSIPLDLVSKKQFHGNKPIGNIQHNQPAASKTGITQ